MQVMKRAMHSTPDIHSQSPRAPDAHQLEIAWLVMPNASPLAIE